MFKFQWNALRVGDRVAVHDDHLNGFELREGVVRIVEARRDYLHDVAIRLDDGEDAVQRPRRHAVHLLPLDGRPPCWRCEVIAGTERGQAGWIEAA